MRLEGFLRGGGELVEESRRLAVVVLVLAAAGTLLRSIVVTDDVRFANGSTENDGHFLIKKYSKVKRGKKRSEKNKKI